MGQVLGRLRRFKRGSLNKQKRLPECHLNYAFVGVGDHVGADHVEEGPEDPAGPDADPGGLAYPSDTRLVARWLRSSLYLLRRSSRMSFTPSRPTTGISCRW